MASPELPAKYTAAVYDEPGKISTKVVELDMPEPATGDVLIKLTHSGVCGSDLALMTNRWNHMPMPTAAGQVGGHEGIGHVVKLGLGAENTGVKVGDRVGIKWLAGICGSCQPCLNGYDAACVRQKVSGFYWPGTFQQYVTSPANYVTPIPDGLDSGAAAPLLCAGVTVYSALRKTELKSGQWVVLMGAGGGLGHLATQVAARGIGLRVIGIDHGSKRDLVLESGAEHFIDFNATQDAAKEVTEITGGLGAHGVVVLTNANGAYATAVDFVRVGGTIACVGIPEGEMLPIATAFPQILIGKSLRIIGVAVGNRQEAIETLDMAARGIIKTHYVKDKLENLTQIFQDMHDGKLSGRVVLEL